MTILNAREHEAQHLLQVYEQLPLEPESAQGVYLHCGGRRILDLYGGHAVASLGYGHPSMLEALNKQAREMLFQSNAVAVKIRAQAAETLTDFAPGDLNHVFFTNSGAESNENALRIAVRLTGRSRVVAIEHGFHGRTAAAGAVTWGAKDSWYGFPETPFSVDFVGRNSISAIDDMVTEKTAAVILELVQGVAGAFDLDPGFVQAIAQTCADRGALLIIDEVQSGIGRCGQPFATNLYNIQPDILTTAKSMAGGFPCGALIVTSDLAGSVGSGDLGSTFGGGPMACALTKTVIEVIKKEQLIENVRTLSELIIKALPLGPIMSAQGKGFLMGLRCARNARKVRDELLARDILVGTSADPMVLRLLPPLILEQQHVQQFLDILAELPEG
jgi:acetylornithine/succinyldiaminopimelate/putrescine aminotransferase